MTGLECLRKELKLRGMTESQINSKVVAVTLDILSHADHSTAFTEEWNAEDRIAALNRAKCESEAAAKMAEARMDQFKRDMNARQEELEQDRKRFEKEKEAWRKELEEFQTDEARDRIRIAKFFENRIIVESKYDNTAYIIGLAAILCRSDEPMKELKKMNPKLFREGNTDD